MGEGIKPWFENKEDKYKSRIKKKKKFWTDKEGKELTFKEFIGRWKSGIQSVTLLQQAKVQVRSTIIMLIGILAGIIVSIMNFSKIWWVTIILVGVFGFTAMQFIGLLQRKKALEEIERRFIK